MLNLENLFLHFLIIIMPVFLYHGFFGKLNHFPNNRQNQFHRFLLLAVAAILSMTFPVASVDGVSYDFRSLVIIFAFLYCGRNYAFLLVLLTCTVRLLLGGKVLQLSLIIVPFYYMLPFLLSYFWSSFSKKKKYFSAILIGSVSMAFFYLVTFIFNFNRDNGTVLPEPPFSNLLIGVLCYIVILLVMIFYEEYMVENTLMRIQIENSEKMNVVSELAASVAHEVRNPLTVVRGFIQLIEKDDKSTTSKEYMQLVLSELSRAEAIISDYLNLARQNTEKRETFLVSNLMKDVMNVMKSFSNMNSVDLTYSIVRECELNGDVSKLKQVFYNLIKNAVESIDHSNGLVMIIVSQTRGNALIEIADNGIGMDTQQLDRIGEPFYTQKETGTGLGVMVTRSIIQSHHGSIEYESEPGKGTKVLITFPLHRTETNETAGSLN
ncbi:GHKL domain-containing protein [Peribacillus cavernae]|uniref:histidine kinase n=1 Tax=Peribacillus cavernae TaxID=1674310 RepID=A0A3S0U525_9BACI|nr:ATP-binding protein [Peribacillus cavernae]MDQ0217273.1 two-component system sporulation sensor kinase B [Peribacillus cavernae]RUQ30260.1 GHKL domain-containing protein [Peribacillus cavernae]